MNSALRTSLVLLLLTISVKSFAQGFSPTQQQIEQFKRMSPAEQQQLARSMGIDLESLGMSGGTNAQPDLRDPTAARVQQETEGGYNLQNQNDFDSGDKTDEEDELADEDSDAGKNEKEKLKAENVKIFGADLFRSAPSAFAPAIDIPVPSDYVMGPGDTIIIQLYGKENISHSLTINREGQIQFPQIGPITLAGLKFSRVQQVIDEIVSEQMIGVKSSVTMGALRTIKVFVLGEVKQPGSFTVGSLSSITNAMFASGGITNVVSMRNIQLKRRGEVVGTLDLYDLLLHGDTTHDQRLLPGDVIFVPPVGNKVKITGAVTRPAIYELKDERRAAEIIKLAGGFTAEAHRPLTRIERISDNGERTLISINLTQKEGQQFKLKDGDHLSVASALEILQHQITLEGHIKRPGDYSWRKGIRFTDLVPSVDSLLPNPDINIALIERRKPGTREVEVTLFSPRQAWAAKHTAKDPILTSQDTIYIFNFIDDRTVLLEEVIASLEVQARYLERQKTVHISGSVRFPGVYPLSENMTTQQLINLAGGLVESAFGNQGEITRYDIGKDLERRVAHISVDLTNEKVALQPGDTLQVKQIPLWKKKETVEVAGEVMFPGTYTILPGETLTDVLTRAGGLTPHAYAVGAIFSREELRKLEQERLDELRTKMESEIAASNVGESTGKETINEEEAEMLLKNLQQVKALGRMVIDLPQILRSPNHHDFQLEDGDIITIPRYKPSVTVMGEVQYPTSNFFDRKLTSLEYIERSGGLKKNADGKRIYIVKANGSVIQPERSSWFRANSKAIAPGDTIVVPLETDRVDKLTVWSQATAIIYQAVLGAVAIGNL